MDCNMDYESICTFLNSNLLLNQIEQLNMSYNNKLEEKSWLLIFGNLNKCNKLKELDISYCDIKDNYLEVFNNSETEFSQLYNSF